MLKPHLSGRGVSNKAGGACIRNWGRIAAVELCLESDQNPAGCVINAQTPSHLFFFVVDDDDNHDEDNVDDHDDDDADDDGDLDNFDQQHPVV